MPETIQSVVAQFFSSEAAWRLRKYGVGIRKGREDIREKCSAQWLEALAAFVEKLPDDDPGIEALSRFQWPLGCFSHGTGAEGLAALRTVGFRGSPTRPYTRPPEEPDLQRSWDAWVVAAERDRYAVERLLLIVGALLDDTSGIRLRGALKKLRGAKLSA